MSDKKRHTIWIDERIWEDVLSHYKSDNCSTQNEFVENALRFYIGYLNTKNAGAFLPQAISSVMIGTMDNYAHRIASQLYKLAVEQNLKWSDLDTKERTLTIIEKRSVERRELVEYEGSTRIISLTPEAVELLRLEHAKHPGSPLMFMHPATQRPYSPQMVRRLHNEIIKEAGLDHIRFADLRHTCAVLSLQNGMDTKEVSQMLGHFRTAMTRQNYAPYLAHIAAKGENKLNKASTEDLREAANILDNLLKF